MVMLVCPNSDIYTVEVWNPAKVISLHLAILAFQTNSLATDLHFHLIFVLIKEAQTSFTI